MPQMLCFLHIFWTDVLGVGWSLQGLIFDSKSVRLVINSWDKFKALAANIWLSHIGPALLLSDIRLRRDWHLTCDLV